MLEQWIRKYIVVVAVAMLVMVACILASTFVFMQSGPEYKVRKGMSLQEVEALLGPPLKRINKGASVDRYGGLQEHVATDETFVYGLFPGPGLRRIYVRVSDGHVVCYIIVNN